MANKFTNNIPVVSVDKLINNLSIMYANLINTNNIDKAPSVMLWGPMGVGKSQSIRALGKILEEKTNKKIVITDVRLLLFNPVDLRGIPTANVDKTLAIWLKPQIFQMNDSSDVVNILFLDEISAAPVSVQAAAYQITLDKKVGEHKLPDNTIVIAAGNRTTDKSVAYQMPKALANRLMHFDVGANNESWNKWAVEHNINEKIIGFIKFKQNALMNENLNPSDLAFATPRSWEMVSNILNYVSDDISQVYDLICGLVGNDLAIELKAWCRLYKNLPDIKDIFDGKVKAVPVEPDVLYALCSSMASYAKEHSNELDRIRNSIIYALKMPADYQVVLFKDYMYISPEFKRDLLHIQEFQLWINKKGKLLDVIK